MEKFVLLDRDGVINARPGPGWVRHWEEFRFLPRAVEALRKLNENGYKSIIVSNQSGVGRGLLSEEDLETITANFREEAAKQGAGIEAVFYCTHRPEDGCECRKPRPGLLLKAQREYGFPFPSTFLVGDTEVDFQAGTSVGCPVILIADSGGKPPEASRLKPRAYVSNLYEAVEYILRNDAAPPA